MKRLGMLLLAALLLAGILPGNTARAEAPDMRIEISGGSGSNATAIALIDYNRNRLTNIVVTCQSERSQHKNKANAMRILRARLYDLEDSKRRANIAAESAAKGDNAWGNQIRSYVVQPYQMVKDLRTDAETSNIGAVLDGDLDMFAEAYLRTGGGHAVTEIEE